jgi:hypothetical protein
MFEGIGLIANYYARGLNTRNDFRGTDYISEDAMKAGGKYAAEDIARGLYEIGGLSPFLGKLERDTDASRKKTEFQKQLEHLPGSVWGTFYFQTDAGLKEPFRDATKRAGKEEAIDRIKARDAADSLFKDKKLTPEQETAIGGKPELVKKMMLHKSLVESGDYQADALTRAGSRKEKAYIVTPPQ